MPGRKDLHAHQARNVAVALVAIICLVVVGALALVG